ncbi:ubiquitin-conjugating enzyme E2 34-like [Nymphaea colorata]|nr:ubiquitin-conjugating enzyme E2 34-like [Nymphaea colorata]XP_031490354.1 ubiquitin-conjugating enzyme E2 34-like [Nymphaea colorata]XP_031490355.1 ubiquitin-conjugating enzyme E2 34-like [Nymphaea colorata]
MAERACVKRLQKEYRALCKEPVPHILARPNPNDILEWHYVLEGSEGTPFAGGIYYGKVKFPSDYPFKPPGISMITPNGRFATQKRICMSMSDFHPETWNPMWSVSSILTGLLSFMMDNSPTTGSVSTTVAEKQRLARASLAFNCKSPMFRKMFPEYVEQYNQLQNAEKLNSDRLAEKEQPHAASETEGKEKEDNGVLDKRNQRHTSKIPFWLLFFIFSVLCAIMALPLLLI